MSTPGFSQTGTTPGSTGSPASDISSTSTSSKATTTQVPPSREALILARIHRANQNEIEMANLAKENASSDAVRRLAGRIYTDHSRADDQVLAFARSHHIELPVAAQRAELNQMQMDEAHAKAVGSAAGEYTRSISGTGGAGTADQDDHDSTIAKLRNLKGAEFDREFVNAMVVDHQKTIDRLTKARSEIKDRDTLALIDKLLPTLKQHLSMAQKVQSNLKS